MMFGYSRDAPAARSRVARIVVFFCLCLQFFVNMAEMSRWSNKALNGGCHHMRYCQMAEISIRFLVPHYAVNWLRRRVTAYRVPLMIWRLFWSVIDWLNFSRKSRILEIDGRIPATNPGLYF
jgi:hypothetical protein